MNHTTVINKISELGYKGFKEATVSQSYHIFLDGCEYSVPYKYLGV